MTRIGPAAALLAGMAAVVSCCLLAAESSRPIPDVALGLPPVETKDHASAGIVALGRRLFFDTRLSRDGKVSCATCHDPEHAFTDSRPVSLGVDGVPGTRNAPSLLNVAYQDALFWDGRRATLEAQATDPLFNSRELGLTDLSEFLSRLSAGAGYREAFAAAFANKGTEPSLAQAAQALAAYERTLLVADSPFDRYFYAKQEGAIPEAARRGFEVFRGHAHCAECHIIGADGAMFSDGRFHGGVGLKAIASRLPELTGKALALDTSQVSAVVTTDPDLAALGRFLVTKDPQDIGKYKTPSLRNVALTAPYMHDGSLATLREAVEYEIYYRSVELGRPLVVTPSERDDLVAFLQALTSPCVVQRSCPGM